MLLKGEVALVTGGGRGIGKAIALALAREGAHLGLISRTKAELELTADEARRYGIAALNLPCDISQPWDVDVVVGKALSEFRKIDVLVNCAGILGPIGFFAENDVQSWIEAIEVNLIGTCILMRAVLPHMISRRKGAIINLSGGGAVNPRPRFSAYGASKTAVVRLTETVAEEVKESNIRVNAISPGAVNTRMLDQVLAAGEGAGKEFYRRAKEQKEKGGTPPEKAAELAVFLASPAAEGVTGRLISAVWDDWKTLPDRVEELKNSALFTLRRIDGRNFREVR